MDFLQEVWSGVLAEMRKEFSQTMMNLWFECLELAKLTENNAVLVIKNDFKRDMLVSKYKDKLGDYFRLLGFDVEVSIISTEKAPLDAQLASLHGISSDNSDDSFDYSDRGESAIERDFSKLAEEIRQKSEMAASAQNDDSEDKKKIQQNYTFDNFVVGNSNKFAHAACLAVASNPTNEYNPLFIYGPSGLGKTHLLYAIINKISSLNPDYKIVYIKGDDFTNQLIESLRKSTNEQFRDKYRKADVLLIDDIQFIAGKDSTQEEFFHTFNALYAEKKQIILTSDRPPRDIKTLEDRLKTRFEWGLIADIQPPDFELRIAILKNKAEALKINLPNDVLHFLADNLKNNVRQLEGAVKKLGAQSMLTGVPITVDLAISCIADLLTASEPVTVTVDRIIEKVSKKYSIAVDEIKGRKRTKDIAAARHITVYLIRKLTNLSLPAIGKIFGRDHATILNSLDAVEAELKKNTLFEIEINELTEEIKHE